MVRDLIMLTGCYVYVVGVLVGTERLRTWRNYPVEFTRKVVHIAAGMTVWLLLVFEHLPIALIPPISFIFINIYSHKKGTFQAMETGERGNLGTIYFPIAFAVLTGLLWGQRALSIAALMPMTWGDALAAVVGRRWGRHRFNVLGSRRSLEGSLAFAATAWIATALPLLIVADSPFADWAAVLIAARVALGTALVEAITPWGVDNLTVPAAAAVMLVWPL